MGLNSFTTYILMKYYIQELLHINESNLNNLNKSVNYLEKQILIKDGLYKTKNDKIYKYKLFDNETFLINNYIDNFTLICSNTFWKKMQEVFHLPYEHHIFKLTTITYKLFPTSTTKFIIEKDENNTILDFYFVLKETHDNFSLKEDITSFLSLLLLS